MTFLRFLKYISILLFCYILIVFLIYIISGFLLINNVTPNNKLINTYQVNYYLNSGIRNIWQSNPNCTEYDKDLIFVPKKTECSFNNPEFNTKVSFDSNGRFSKHPNSNTKIHTSEKWLKCTNSEHFPTYFAHPKKFAPPFYSSN